MLTKPAKTIPLNAQKEAAVKVLADELSDIRTQAIRARLLMQELQEAYFERYTPDNERGRLEIACDFRWASIYAGIIGGFIHSILETAGALEVEK